MYRGVVDKSYMPILLLIVVLVALSGVIGCSEDDVTNVDLSQDAEAYDLTGRAVSHNSGAAIPGATYLHVGTGQAGTCDDDGLFVISPLDEGLHQLVVGADGYASSRVNIVLDENHGAKNIQAHHDFRLVEASASLRLTVIGEWSGEPLAGATVEIAEASIEIEGADYGLDLTSFDNVGVTDGDGVVDFEGMPACSVLVAIIAYDEDGDGASDYNTYPVALELAPDRLLSHTVLVPMILNDEVSIVHTNQPDGYDDLLSDVLWFLFSEPMDVSPGNWDVQLVQYSSPYMPIPVNVTWATPVRLEIAPLISLIDLGPRFRLTLQCVSETGKPYNETSYIDWIVSLGGDCDDWVTDLSLDIGTEQVDYDTDHLVLRWSSVSCPDGYRLYARDTWNVSEWLFLEDVPVDYDWGDVIVSLDLPGVFDRYGGDTITTPFAGVEVSFCVVPFGSTEVAPGGNHAVLTVADTTPPALETVHQVGGAKNTMAGADLRVDINVGVSEYVAQGSLQPTLEIREAGGDPAFVLDPNDGIWSWHNGGHNGVMLFFIPPGVDASGDEYRWDFDGIEDMSGNSSTDATGEWETLSAYAGFYDFESSRQGWVRNGDGWYYGTPQTGPRDAYSGINCWSTNEDSYYGDDWDTSLYSRPTLVCAEETTLGFAYWCELDTYGNDVLSVNVVVESGATYELGTFTERDQLWRYVEFGLGDYVGQVIQVEFHFVSNSYYRGDGFFIDDVQIGCD